MGLMGKAVLLYLCLAIAISFYQPELVLGDGNSMLKVFHIGVNSTTNEPYISSTEQNFANNDLNANLDPTNEKTGMFRTFVNNIISGFQIFFDGLWMVIGVIKILFNFAFSPILIFTSPMMVGAPFPIVFIILFPLIFMFLIGIIYFIRSGQ